MSRSLHDYIRFVRAEDAYQHKEWELIIPKWRPVSTKDGMFVGVFVGYWIKVDAIICKLEAIRVPPALSCVYWYVSGDAWHYWVIDEQNNLFDIYLPRLVGS